MASLVHVGVAQQGGLLSNRAGERKPSKEREGGGGVV